MMKDNLVHIYLFLQQCSISTSHIMSLLLQFSILHYNVLISLEPSHSFKVQIWSPWSSHDERHSCTHFSGNLHYSCSMSLVFNIVSYKCSDILEALSFIQGQDLVTLVFS
uniref:Uncharacterized protein n=1 Tax=Cacopsylla melanoneura TaxID=428564 RepID=A0A8D8YEN6_9HEMI